MKLQDGLVRIPMDINISDLANFVAEIDESEWNAWTHRQNSFAVHSKTQTIPFAWSDNFDAKMDVKRYNKDTVLESKILPFVSFLESKFSGRATKVMLAKLPAGCSITPHIDIGELENIHRVHIPVITNQNVKFNVAGVDYRLSSGCAYELSNMDIHSVENNSSKDRVHLIIDIL